MKFLADEGIDRTIVDGLRKLSFDVFYVIEETRSLSDNVLLEIAAQEERILITKDKDFGELVFRLNKAHHGVVLLRLEGLTTQERADITCPLILKHSSELPNAFTVIQKGIIRIRQGREV
jgi:predicted nuclease of predicted toxin-antitoxin system